MRVALAGAAVRRHGRRSREDDVLSPGRAGRSRGLAAAACAAVLWGLATPSAAAQSPNGSGGAWQPRIIRILVDSVAVRPVLRELWEESVETGREQVACIGGERRGREFRIGRAEELREALRRAQARSAGHSAGDGDLAGGAQVDPDGGIDSDVGIDSDSVSVSREWSRLSVELCGPPEWVGTVHTHRVEDGVEYPGLSSSDRAIVSLWHARWRRESVFCVLYSPEKPPYCEHQS